MLFEKCDLFYYSLYYTVYIHILYFHINFYDLVINTSKIDIRKNKEIITWFCESEIIWLNLIWRFNQLV